MTPVTIRSMRQSTLNTADTCLKRIEYMLDPEIPKHGSVSRSIGTGCHAGLAHYYGLRMNEDIGMVPPRDGSITEAAFTAFDADVAENDTFSWVFQPKAWRAELIVFKREDALNMIQNTLTRYFSEELMWGPEWIVKGVEIPFELPYDGLSDRWPRTGMIDLALEHATEGNQRLVDHKTSKKKWDKKKSSPTNSQAAWYIDAWRSMTGNLADFYYDVIGLVDGSFERRLAPRTEAQIQATLERGRDIARLIDKGGPFPANPSHFLCSPHWCDFWKMCPYGETLNLN